VTVPVGVRSILTVQAEYRQTLPHDPHCASRTVSFRPGRTRIGSLQSGHWAVIVSCLMPISTCTPRATLGPIIESQGCKTPSNPVPVLTPKFWAATAYNSYNGTWRHPKILMFSTCYVTAQVFSTISRVA
jgi:hypothetical protein